LRFGLGLQRGYRADLLAHERLDVVLDFIQFPVQLADVGANKFNVSRHGSPAFLARATSKEFDKGDGDDRQDNERDGLAALVQALVQVTKFF
jgi:hypothetical protein